MQKWNVYELQIRGRYTFQLAANWQTLNLPPIFTRPRSKSELRVVGLGKLCSVAPRGAPLSSLIWPYPVCTFENWLRTSSCFGLPTLLKSVYSHLATMYILYVVLQSSAMTSMYKERFHINSEWTSIVNENVLIILYIVMSNSPYILGTLGPLPGYLEIHDLPVSVTSRDV